MNSRDWIEMLVLSAVWGASFLFLHVVAPDIGPIGVAALRVSGGALLLVPLVILNGHWRQVLQHGPYLLLSAVLSSLLPFMGFSLASRSLSAGLLSILNATTPMWGALIGWLWAGERMTPLRVAGLALGLSGVVLLTADRSQLQAHDAYGAAALALGSSLSYAFAVHYNKRYLAQLPPVSASGGTLLMACLLMLAPALWLGPQPAIANGLHATPNASWREVPVHAWLALGFLAFACTGAAYVVFFRLIERIGASRALTVTFMIPAFGMLWGALFLHEHISPQMILSAGIILLGTWLSNQASTPAVLRWRVARN